jgi:hypothetical protein
LTTQVSEERLGLLQQQLLTASKNHGTEMQEAWQSIADARSDAVALRDQVQQEQRLTQELSEQVCLQASSTGARLPQGGW